MLYYPILGTENIFRKAGAMKRVKKKAAQQIVETLLLFAVVIVVLIIFLGPTGPFKNAVRGIINMVVEEIYP